MSEEYHNIFTSRSQAKLFKLMLAELLHNEEDEDDVIFKQFIDHLLAVDDENDDLEKF